MELMEIDLNTSHVKVKLKKREEKVMLSLYLNTSHVKVKQCH